MTESYYYILLCLYEEPSYGYKIMQRTAQLSEQRVKIGSGTMYGAVSNMIKKGWITETAGGLDEQDCRRLYRLTLAGEEVLFQEIIRIVSLAQGAKNIVDAKGGPNRERLPWNQ